MILKDYYKEGCQFEIDMVHTCIGMTDTHIIGSIGT